MTESRKTILKNAVTVFMFTSLIFSCVMTIVMLMTWFTLETVQPIRNPAVSSILEKINTDPANTEIRETYRALNLLARKAFFSGTRQLETGKNLLVAGLVIFFLCFQFRQNLGGYSNAPGKPLPAGKGEILTKHLPVWIFTLVMVVAGIGISRIDAILMAENSKRMTYPDLKTDTQQNWTAFRNMGRAAEDNANLPVSWDDKTGKNIRWKQKLSLPGFSSPVVWKSTIFLDSANDEQFQIQARNLDDGSLLWSHAISIPDPKALPRVSQDTGYAAATPAVDVTGVYSLFADGTLIALSHEGKPLWSKKFAIPENEYGHASSLLCYNGKVIVQWDTNDGSSVQAFSSRDGTEVWKTSRKTGISWASPILAEWEDSVYLLLNSNPAISAYDPETGVQLWSTDCLSGEVAPSLAYSNGILAAAIAYSKVTALDVKTGSIIWQTGGSLPDVTSPIAGNNIVIIPSTYGTITAQNLTTGDEYWFHELYDGFYSSPVIAGNTVYLCDLAGNTIIFSLSEEWEERGTGSLSEPIYATPVITPRGILIRSESHLFLVSESGDES